jgi:chromosomal replication initiator protein
MIGVCRLRHIYIPRAVAIRLARELTDASLPQIGRAFGGRHHATIYHAINRPLTEIDADICGELRDALRR